MSKKITVDYPIDPTMQNIEKQQCPVLFALNIIGQKWKLPLLWHLHIEKNTRYNALKRSIPGITNMMLTKCLRELEADGLVTRHEYQTIPPKVDYSLTERGEAVLPALNEIYKWGSEQMQLKVKNAPEDKSFQK